MPTNLKPSPSGKTAYGDGNPTPALYVIRQTYVTISVTVFLTACRIRNGQTFACATQKRSSAGLLLGKARPKLATEDTYRTAAGKLTRTQVQTTITRLLYLAPIRTPAVPPRFPSQTSYIRREPRRKCIGLASRCRSRHLRSDATPLYLGKHTLPERPASA